MRSYKSTVTALVLVVVVVLAIGAITLSTHRNQRIVTTAPFGSRPDGWQEIVSPEWEFSALLPMPIEHMKTSATTPFGDAPLETYAASVGPVRFTVAASEFDPKLASEFTEQQRYDSAAKETPKLLGGELVDQKPVRQGGVVGRDQLISISGKATLHTRMFIIGNRSYQAQVVYPSRSSIDPTTEELFLNSFKIKYRP